MHVDNHADYTLVALKVFEKYRGVSVASDQTGEKLAEASRDEDSFNPLDWQRLFNWHFYNKEGRVTDGPIPGIRTSEKRVDDLIEDLDECLAGFNQSPDGASATQVLDRAGRLMHHIQDMSTPSHSAPVYHGPDLKDEYETFGKAYAGRLSVDYLPGDGRVDVDGWTVTISQGELDEAVEIDNIDYAKGKHPLFRAYVRAAEQTLMHMKSRFEVRADDKPLSLNWNAFWRELTDDEPAWEEDDGIADFGSFGRLGNNFGRAYFQSNGTFYEIEHAVCFGLYKEMFKKAVLNTVALLNYLNEKAGIFSFDLELAAVDGFADVAADGP